MAARGRNPMKSTKFWIILIAVIGILCVAAALFFRFWKTDSSIADVYQNGELIRSIDLSQVTESYTFTVEGPAGVNTIQVEPGRIRVEQADCPDQICVNQGWISDSLVPIVCLPNGLVIQIEASGKTESEYDSVAG